MAIIKTLVFLLSYLGKTRSQVKGELNHWRRSLATCSDKNLQQLAYKSIQEKAFHCIGGGAYAVLEKKRTRPLLQFIVSFQTISDYLDNLCDEGESQDEQAFLQLHRSMIRALQPKGGHDDYYRFYPYQRDGGYLQSLVEECQKTVTAFPAYHAVQDEILLLVTRYIQLQSLKHLSKETREERLKEWYKKECFMEEIRWYEFAAACGSTLGIFSLLALSCNKKIDTEEKENLYRAYFPWICGLHILLDYLIDAAEDKKKGELNFIDCYQNPRDCQERLLTFLHHAQKNTHCLPQRERHGTIIQGLLALYLSDKKRKTVPPHISSSLLKSGGWEAIFMQRLGCVLRKAGIL